MRFKCHNCLLMLDALDLVEGRCPVCKEHVEEMCENDHICTCEKDVQEGIHFCEDCGKPTCKCGSHNVLTISRVTGYLSDTAGWGRGKRQELKDRKRYEVT